MKYLTKAGVKLINEANQKINLSNLIYLPLPKARPVGKNPDNLQQGNTDKSQNNPGHEGREQGHQTRMDNRRRVNIKMKRDVDESRKQRKAARKRQQTWVSTTRNRESTPFLAQVHQALSTGVGPKDKKTGKVQDLSQWQGHATQQGKQGTGTIDVIGDPVHRRAALQSGRSSRHCVGTACQELVDQFAKDRLSDKTKTQANRDERELHGKMPDAAATRTSLEINSPDTPKGAKGTRVSKAQSMGEDSQCDLDATRDKFREFLRKLGDKRRDRNVGRSTLLPTSSRAIAKSVKGKDTPLAKRLNVAKRTGKL